MLDWSKCLITQRKNLQCENKLNPFVRNIHFLYTLKTSENLTDVFKGQRKGTWETNGLSQISELNLTLPKVEYLRFTNPNFIKTFKLLFYNVMLHSPKKSKRLNK